MVLIGLMLLSAFAAIVAVEFIVSIYEPYDENFDEITGTHSTLEGIFFIDSSTPEVRRCRQLSGIGFWIENLQRWATLARAVRFH
jgi:hypothetical protein